MTITDTTETSQTQAGVGRVARVTGPVVDIEFPHDAIPAVYNALKTTVDFGDGTEPQEITLEVAQHLGDDLVRAIALKPTDGLVRGQEVRDTGEPIMVPSATSPRARCSTSSASRSTSPTARRSR